jgi:rare lipoprotein A
MTRFQIILLSCCFILSSCSGVRPGPAQLGEQQQAAPGPKTTNGRRAERGAGQARFAQEGVAGMFGRTKTAHAGEKFDDHPMTAMHRTLPLGVYVKVRNARNGVEAVVRVNRRGPGSRGRIIDLSSAAAKALGIPPGGTARVRIEALGTLAADNTYEEPPTYETGAYTVQIGAFEDIEQAKRLAEMMKNLFGYSAIVPATEGRQSVYRVFAGKYSTLAGAETAEKNFSSHGYPECFAISLE